MGNNLDLKKMLALPDRIICPACGKSLNPYFDDYDVECGNPNPEPGVWQLDVMCPQCEHEWVQNYHIATKDLIQE